MHLYLLLAVASATSGVDGGKDIWFLVPSAHEERVVVRVNRMRELQAKATPVLLPAEPIVAFAAPLTAALRQQTIGEVLGRVARGSSISIWEIGGSELRVAGRCSRMRDCISLLRGWPQKRSVAVDLRGIQSRMKLAKWTTVILVGAGREVTIDCDLRVYCYQCSEAAHRSLSLIYVRAGSGPFPGSVSGLFRSSGSREARLRLMQSEKLAAARWTNASTGKTLDVTLENDRGSGTYGTSSGPSMGPPSRAAAVAKDGRVPGLPSGLKASSDVRKSTDSPQSGGPPSQVRDDNMADRTTVQPQVSATGRSNEVVMASPSPAEHSMRAPRAGIPEPPKEPTKDVPYSVPLPIAQNDPPPAAVSRGVTSFSPTRATCQSIIAVPLEKITADSIKRLIECVRSESLAAEQLMTFALAADGRRLYDIAVPLFVELAPHPRFGEPSVRRALKIVAETTNPIDQSKFALSVLRRASLSCVAYKQIIGMIEQGKLAEALSDAADEFVGRAIPETCNEEVNEFAISYARLRQEAGVVGIGTMSASLMARDAHIRAVATRGNAPRRSQIALKVTGARDQFLRAIGFTASPISELLSDPAGAVEISAISRAVGLMTRAERQLVAHRARKAESVLEKAATVLGNVYGPEGLAARVMNTQDPNRVKEPEAWLLMDPWLPLFVGVTPDSPDLLAVRSVRLLAEGRLSDRLLAAGAMIPSDLLNWLITTNLFNGSSGDKIASTIFAAPDLLILQWKNELPPEDRLIVRRIGELSHVRTEGERRGREMQHKELYALFTSWPLHALRLAGAMATRVGGTGFNKAPTDAELTALLRLLRTNTNVTQRSIVAALRAGHRLQRLGLCPLSNFACAEDLLSSFPAGWLEALDLATLYITAERLPAGVLSWIRDVARRDSIGSHRAAILLRAASTLPAAESTNLLLQVLDAPPMRHADELYSALSQAYRCADKTGEKAAVGLFLEGLLGGASREAAVASIEATWRIGQQPPENDCRKGGTQSVAMPTSLRERGLRGRSIDTWRVEDRLTDAATVDSILRLIGESSSALDQTRQLSNAIPLSFLRGIAVHFRLLGTRPSLLNEALWRTDPDSVGLAVILGFGRIGSEDAVSDSGRSKWIKHLLEATAGYLSREERISVAESIPETLGVDPVTLLSSINLR